MNYSWKRKYLKALKIWAHFGKCCSFSLARKKVNAAALLQSNIFSFSLTLHLAYCLHCVCVCVCVCVSVLPIWPENACSTQLYRQGQICMSQLALARPNLIMNSCNATHTHHTHTHTHTHRKRETIIIIRTEYISGTKYTMVDWLVGLAFLYRKILYIDCLKYEKSDTNVIVDYV